MTEMNNEEQNDVYDYCPTCGLPWDKHTELKGISIEGEETFERLCPEEHRIKINEPVFCMEDLDNYKETLLIEIARWQHDKIAFLEKKLKESK